MASRRATGPADVELDIRAMFKSLLRAIPFLIVFTALVAGGTFYLLSTIPPSYTAEAKILIEAGESSLTRSEGGVETIGILDREAVASQVQLIRSGDLARVVAAKLDLEAQPEYQEAIEGGSFLDDFLAEIGLAKHPAEVSVEERVLAEFYKNLQVFAVPNSRVIAITFSSRDPELAARAANAIAAEYIDLQKAAMRDTTEDATRWLESEIADLREKVSAAEAKVEAFRSENDLFSSGGGQSATLTQQQLVDLNADLARVRAAKTDAETKASQILASLSSGAVPNVTDVLNSQLIQRLVEQQVALRAQIAELSVTLLPGHPRMRQLSAQLENLDSQISAEARKIVDSLKAEAELSQAREEEIYLLLDGLKASVATAGDAEVQLRALEREASAQRELLDTYLLRFRQADGRRNSDYLPANARIISRAVAPIEPDFPKVVPMTAVATIAALMLAIAFVLLRELANGRATRRVMLNDVLPIVPDAVPVVGHMRWADDHGVHRMMPGDPTLAPALPDSSQQSLVRISDEIIAGRKRCILVTMAEGAEDTGRPLAAAAIARAIARADRRVLLIDFRADGANSEAMGEGTDLPGFADLFAGDASFAQVIFRDRKSRAHFIPAGRAPVVASQFADVRMATLLEALDHTYDHLVIDAGDELIEGVGPEADVTVVVSEFGSADPRTVQAFDRIGAVSSQPILLLMVDSAMRETERPEVAA